MLRLRSSLALLSILFAGTAHAEMAAAVRAGTLGIGLDLNIGLTEQLNLRVGYSAFDYDETLEDTDVTYEGEAKLRNATALLDWHVMGGGFRLSFGAIGAHTTVDATGEPTNGTYEIDDQVFTAAQVGTLRGEIEMGNSIAPYVGIGWGNTVDKANRVTFLLDIGAAYTGTPEVNLIATCGTAAPPGSGNCNRLQAAVREEEDELAEDATLYEWYPVLSLGIAVRF